MVNAGYKLALDDYVPDERMRPLVELASVVKIDVLNRLTRNCATSPTIFGRAEFDSSPSA
jgi:c-di-GMP-related signal transduction protein